MLINNNYIILLFILSLVIFYIYISSDNLDFIEKLFQLSNKDKHNPTDKVTKKLPEFSNKNNYLDIIDTNSKHVTKNIVSHETYEKLTFTDTILKEVNSMIVPIISKLNKILKTNYSKDYIDYKYIEKKTDNEQNTLYVIILVLFQRGFPQQRTTQKELVFEIHKGGDDSVTINKIIDQSQVYKLNFEDKYNSSNIYTHPDPDSKGTNLPIIPQCSSSCYPSSSAEKNTNNTDNTEHFKSRAYDFDESYPKHAKNKNISKISKYYNLSKQIRYPNIIDQLFNRKSTDTNTLEGVYSSELSNSNINFKVNKYGIQDKSNCRNAWLIDEEKTKQITKIFPQNKITNKWDNTGTSIPEHETDCNDSEGIDYACETREKIPRFHPGLFSYFANNGFNNSIDSGNMFSLIHKGAENHTPF